MSSIETTLRALRTQVGFELVEAAAEVITARDLSAGAQGHVSSQLHRTESFMRRLREIGARPQPNAALYLAVRQCCRAEEQALREWRIRLADAQQRERRARSALAELRNKERSLERALHAERRKRQRRVSSLEMIRADELWLQHSLRERA